MSWASTCPAAIAGLLVAFRRSAALAPPDVLVTRGMGITDPDANAVVSVGFSGSPGDEGAAEAQLTGDGAGAVRDREQYAIRCAIGVTSGDEGEDGRTAAEERAFALLGACGDAISADRTLNRAVMSARIASWSLDGGQVSDGVLVVIRFSVAIDAFTR